jgi:2-phospho-L-lactate/phosphoenolpyruvate guanylyltransferase
VQPVTRAGVVVPIRAFALGKARLAGHLPDGERSALARRLAENVVRASAGLTVVVVSSDDEVREWAAALGVSVVADPGSLDTAAAAGRDHLAARGVVRTVVAHADLPDVRDFASVLTDASQPVAVLVPCHRDDGTPVLSLPTAAPFTFAYGAGSFRRHVVAARAAGLAVRVVRDPALAFDVDTVDDLELLTTRR